MVEEQLSNAAIMHRSIRGRTLVIAFVTVNLRLVLISLENCRAAVKQEGNKTTDLFP